MVKLVEKCRKKRFYKKKIKTFRGLEAHPSIQQNLSFMTSEFSHSA